MSEVAELDRVVKVAAVAGIVGGASPALVPTMGAPSKPKNFRFPMRRHQRVQTKAEIAANRALIEDFIATKGVTVCRPGYANGSVPTQYEFV